MKDHEYNEGKKALFQPQVQPRIRKKTLRKPANPVLPAILAARFKASPAASVRVSQEVHSQ